MYYYYYYYYYYDYEEVEEVKQEARHLLQVQQTANLLLWKFQSCDLLPLR